MTPSHPSSRPLAQALVAFAAAGLAVAAQAAPVQITLTLQNLAAPNSVSFAPLHVGFHQGTFDAFNNGQAAGAARISHCERAEGGWEIHP